MKDELDIYQEAMTLWGFDIQAGVLAEECCELGKATLKLMRFIKVWDEEPNRDQFENFVEELADVHIMVQQFYHSFLGYDDKILFQDFKKKKLERVAGWIERDKITLGDEQ